MARVQWNAARWVLYACLFIIGAVGMLVVSGVFIFLASFLLWLVVPSGLAYGTFVFASLLLFGGLLLLAWRRRWGWLAAISLGGASVPGLMIALMLLSPFLPHPPREPEPNQREPVTSPSGNYVLTVPIERSETQTGPFGYGLPFWHVTISEPNGAVVYRDPNEQFHGIHNVYWTWGDDDRVWLYDSDDGTVYFYERAEGNWTRAVWGQGRTGHSERDIAPPEALYPAYVSGGPARSLGTPWTLAGFSATGGDALISFRNTATGEFMMLKVGESKNGITLLEWDGTKREAVCEIKGRRVTMDMRAFVPGTDL
jgi:hypothetical protein